MVEQPKLHPQPLPKPLHRLRDILLARRRKSGPEEHLLPSAPFRSEPTPLGRQHPTLNPTLNPSPPNLLLQLQQLHRLPPPNQRMFPPIHLDPMKHTRLGRNPARHLPWEEPLTCNHDVVSFPRILQPHPDQPVQITRVTPRLVQQFEEDELGNPARHLRRDFGMPDDPLDDLRRGRYPAGAHAGRNDLGERIHTHDAAVGIHAQQRRYECVQERIMR